MGWGFSRVPLQYPLAFAGGSVQKRGKYYSALIWIEPKERDAFCDVSEVFKEELAQGGHSFALIDKNGSGYVKKQDLVVAVVFDMGNKTGDKVIAVGTNGACPRKLSKALELCQGLGELENIANMFINSCYSARKANVDDALLHLCGL